MILRTYAIAPAAASDRHSSGEDVATCSPLPPCGGGVGRGVAGRLRVCVLPPSDRAKLGRAPPQGGSGEQAAPLQDQLRYPVEPKPPGPRTVPPSASAATISTEATGAITSCAMRIPRRTRKGSRPWLISSTISSPR